MVGDVVVCELRFSDVLTAHIGSVVYSAQFSADGRQILSASDNNTVRIWSAVTGECEQAMMGHTDVSGSVGGRVQPRRSANRVRGIRQRNASVGRGHGRVNIYTNYTCSHNSDLHHPLLGAQSSCDPSCNAPIGRHYGPPPPRRLGVLSAE